MEVMSIIKSLNVFDSKAGLSTVYKVGKSSCV